MSEAARFGGDRSISPGLALPPGLPLWPALWRGFLWGVLAALAIPPLTVAPLLLLAIPGLLGVIARARSGPVAAAVGLAFGLGYNLVGLYWITEAILVMAAQFWWAVPIAVPLLSAVLGLFIAAPCALAWLVPAGWRRVAVLAGAWVLFDLLRQYTLSGFPWNLLGSAWEMPGAAGLVFMQPAAWVGIHGLTLGILLLASSPVLHRRGRLAAIGLFAVWAAAGAARLYGVTATPLAPPGLQAVMVQGNVSEADHRDHGGEPAWAEHVFDRHLALTRRGMAQVTGRPAIVLWPETASPYPLAQDAGARRAVADAASPALMTLAGTIRFESDTVAHNSLVAIAPDGSVAGLYDKVHLVPFGEYFPGYSQFLMGEQGFAPGRARLTLHLAGLPAIGPLICYEAIFPGQVTAAGDRPALLVNITNDAWFGDSAGPRQHLAAARMRTIEEGLPMVRAANTGISAVIDVHGRVLAQLGLGRAGVLVASVPGVLPPPLFARFGLAIPIGLAVASLLCGVTNLSQKLKRVQKLRILF